MEQEHVRDIELVESLESELDDIQQQIKYTIDDGNSQGMMSERMRAHMRLSELQVDRQKIRKRIDMAKKKLADSLVGFV